MLQASKQRTNVSVRGPSITNPDRPHDKIESLKGTYEKLRAQLPNLERYAPILLGSLAFLLALPSLRAGLIADDYFHRIILLRMGELASYMNPIMDLFAFVKEGEVGERMREIGYLPWWSDPSIRIALFRPLTALTHIADYALWPDIFALQHLQSLGWFATGVALVVALYQRIPGSTPAVAILAGLLFAVDDSHAYPAGWLANRNAVVCLVFGALVLLMHIQWRLTGKSRYLLAAVLLFAAGLGCGEAALGTLGYLAAWHLTMEKETPLKRAMVAFVPYLGIVLLWRVMYHRLGYGITGSDLYVDPGQHPFLFLRAMIERWPILAAGQWLQLPIDLWIMLSRSQRLALSLACILLTGGLIVLLRPILRQPLARFWALGMAFSLIPVCAAFPMDRLLIFAGIGAFALLALLVDSYVLSRPPSPFRWRKGAAVILLLLHGPLAAILLTVRTLGLPEFGSFFTAAARQNPSGPDITDQTFVYINGNDFPVVYGRVVQIVNNAPVPRRIVQLSSMMTNNRIDRVDDNTIVVTPENGFLDHSLDRLLASSDRIFHEGERISHPDYNAEVLRVTEDGRPASVSFRFRLPLESPELRWLCWQDLRLQEFTLPHVGQSTELAAVPLFQ